MVLGARGEAVEALRERLEGAGREVEVGVFGQDVDPRERGSVGAWLAARVGTGGVGGVVTYWGDWEGEEGAAKAHELAGAGLHVAQGYRRCRRGSAGMVGDARGARRRGGVGVAGEPVGTWDGRGSGSDRRWR